MTPYCREDSFFACLAYLLTGNELERINLRKKCLLYFCRILSGQPTEKLHVKTLSPQCVKHIAVRYWTRNVCKRDAFDFYENEREKMHEAANLFVKKQKLCKDDSFHAAAIFAQLISILYRVNIVLPSLTLSPGAFQSNACPSLYIHMKKGPPTQYHVEGETMSTLLEYTLRVCNGNDENREVGKFTRPKKFNGRVHWHVLKEPRRDLIYLIYPGERDRFYLSIPDNQHLYVFTEEGECLASASNEYRVYPYFCLGEGFTGNRLAVVLAETLEEGKEAVIKERG